jgi:hypothetical protein
VLVGEPVASILNLAGPQSLALVRPPPGQEPARPVVSGLVRGQRWTIQGGTAGRSITASTRQRRGFITGTTIGIGGDRFGCPISGESLR